MTKVSIYKITGDRKTDGLIGIGLGLFLLAINILGALFIGYPEQWLWKFGGELGSFLLGLHLVTMFGGVVLFTVGFWLYHTAKIKVKELPEIPKSWGLLLGFFGILVLGGIFVMKGLLNPMDFLLFLKMLFLAVFGTAIITTVAIMVKKLLD